MRADEFLAPVKDRYFAQSRIHGADAQRAFMLTVMKYCKQLRTAVDVGAHIGTCTDVLASHFEKVLAFEPTEENYACLQTNVGGRAQLEKTALGALRSTGLMVEPPNANSGMWYFSNSGNAVTVRTLDEYELHDVDLVKVDTEGMEGEVLLGAISTIWASKPVIVFEDNGNGRKYYGDRWVDPKPILRSLGYSKKVRLNKDEVWIPCE